MKLESCATELSCWGNIQERYIYWKNFMEEQVVFSLSDSSLHTKNHCARVLLYDLAIGDEIGLTDKDMDALGAAAVFHDSRRQDDWMDVGHGQRTADYYREYCLTHSLSYDERVYRIMAFHDQDDGLGEAALAEWEEGGLLYHIFKDADALDRFRLGPNGLDVRYLRTDAAKSLYDYAKQTCEDGVPLQ